MHMVYGYINTHAHGNIIKKIHTSNYAHGLQFFTQLPMHIVLQCYMQHLDKQNCVNIIFFKKMQLVTIGRPRY